MGNMSSTINIVDLYCENKNNSLIFLLNNGAFLTGEIFTPPEAENEEEFLNNSLETDNIVEKMYFENLKINVKLNKEFEDKPYKRLKNDETILLTNVKIKFSDGSIINTPNFILNIKNIIGFLVSSKEDISKMFS